MTTKIIGSTVALAFLLSAGVTAAQTSTTSGAVTPVVTPADTMSMQSSSSATAMTVLTPVPSPVGIAGTPAVTTGAPATMAPVPAATVVNAPNTGAGGNAAQNTLVLAASALVAIAGVAFLSRKFAIRK